MKGRLCLHAADVREQSRLLRYVKRMLPGAADKYRVKEKYFNDSDMYKFRLVRFTQAKVHSLRVICAWGMLLASDKPVPVADIILEFDNSQRESLALAEQLLRRLLGGRLHFVLEEPDFSLRLAQLRGCFWPADAACYDKGNAASVLLCHLPWQLYGVSKLWEQVLATGGERRQWRQLRVKLRRLRSSLTMCRPLLSREEADRWQQLLKSRAAVLSAVREYDVLLQACSRLRMRLQQETGAQQAEVLSRLTSVLRRLRQQELEKALRGLQLNQLTLELACLLLELHQAGQEAGMGMEQFFRRRLGAWADRLQLLPEKYPDLSDMEQLHRIRIKLKRFRYALQTVPELPAAPRLLRSLKYLQDALGLVHDAYVGRQLLLCVLRENPRLPELRCEAALLTGWEQARADAALEQLPRQWENFSLLLGQWQAQL